MPVHIGPQRYVSLRIATTPCTNVLLRQVVHIVHRALHKLGRNTSFLRTFANLAKSHPHIQQAFNPSLSLCLVPGLEANDVATTGTRPNDLFVSIRRLSRKASSSCVTATCPVNSPCCPLLFTSASMNVFFRNTPSINFRPLPCCPPLPSLLPPTLSVLSGSFRDLCKQLLH